MTHIRACIATDLTYQGFVTWYGDGTVLRWWRGSDTSETIDGVHNLAAFNDLLHELEVYPLGHWRKRRREPEPEPVPF